MRHGLGRRRDNVNGEKERNGEHRNKWQDRTQLAAQIGVGAILDPPPDFLHLRSAFVFAQNLAAQQERIDQSQKGSAQDAPDRHLFKCG
jgi:hypothetical protein